MNIKQDTLANLSSLNLEKEEARLYLELLSGPTTHLHLARTTGINRTKVYRLVENLEKRSLVSRRTDDRGTFIMANDPSALEIELAHEEGRVQKQREVFTQLLPELRVLSEAVAKDQFAVQTYEGVEGFKQMQWHELRTKGELLVLGNMAVEDLGIDHRWAEKFRLRNIEQGYRIRELFNKPYRIPDFTKIDSFWEMYDARIVLEEDLPVSTPITVYNDTVAIYQFDDNRRVGAEIVNAAYATTMRHIFEHYWRLGKPF
jgi:hypothetical protein